MISRYIESWRRCMEHAGTMVVVGALISTCAALDLAKVGLGGSLPASARSASVLAPAAIKPPPCKKTVTSSGVTVRCTIDPAGPFSVTAWSSAAYTLSWSVRCGDDGGIPRQIGGKFLINGFKRVKVNDALAPSVETLMADFSPCRVTIRAIARHLAKPHEIRGKVGWTHYLADTVFYD